MRVLVTGGTGYIGSHTAIALIAAGHTPILVDNYSNSSPRVLALLEAITQQPLLHQQLEVRDQAALQQLCQQQAVEAVIHFAGLKAVGESVAQPLRYYQNNLDSTLSLLAAMQQVGINQLVFSSSATVYGDPRQLPLTERSPLQATNPYGQTKLMIETMLGDLAASQQGWNLTSLRYFNPIGAHPSGLIGEDPTDVPNNLLPYIAQVAVGRRQQLSVFGGDYPTVDGTGVRDYVHVMDVAQAHVAALEQAAHPDQHRVYNIGTGRGTSVLELIRAFEQASGQQIPYTIVDRRPGDSAACFADVSLARQQLGWQAQHDIVQACADAWRWQKQNPAGYADAA